MTPQILEGTLAEIQQQLNALPVEPEARLHVIVTNAGPLDMLTREPFRPTEFRNGVPLLPRRNTTEPVTLELVKQFLDEEDEESLRAYRTSRP